MSVGSTRRVPVQEITRHAKLIDRVLREDFAVPERDRPDVVQEVIFAAWRRMDAGAFRLPRTITSAEAVHRCVVRWLLGVTWRQALKYRSRASSRYETPDAGAAQRVEGFTPSSCERVEARLALAALERLPSKVGDALRYTAVGCTAAEIAKELGENANTISTRVRIGRRRLRQAGVRWSVAEHAACWK